MLNKFVNSPDAFVDGISLPFGVECYLLLRP